MTDADYQELGLLAKAVIVVAIVLFVAGVLWHGVTLKVRSIWMQERLSQATKFITLIPEK